MKAVIIFGPTAVGKTELLTHFIHNQTHTAGSFEVISADSRQIYKDIPIASAHPDNTLLQAIPHHLVGNKNFTENYTVFDFVSDTHTLIQKIHSRNNYPLIVGGTAFYLYNLWQGVPQTPASDLRIRQQLQEQLIEQGIDALYHHLLTIDPLYANKISRNDSYRIVRALEVFELTGSKLSSFEQNSKATHNVDFLVLGLTRPRPILYQRINNRIDIMLEHGLLEEAKFLYGLFNQNISEYSENNNTAYNILRTIGIQELLASEYILDCFKHNTAIDITKIETIIDTIKQNSRHYAKRQETFFKKFDNVQWINLEEPINYSNNNISAYELAVSLTMNYFK